MKSPILAIAAISILVMLTGCSPEAVQRAHSAASAIRSEAINQCLASQRRGTVITETCRLYLSRIETLKANGLNDTEAHRKLESELAGRITE